MTKFINIKNNEKCTIALQTTTSFKNFDPKKSKRPDNELSIALSAGNTGTLELGNTQFLLLKALARGKNYDFCDAIDDDKLLSEEDLKEAHRKFQTKEDVFKDSTINGLKKIKVTEFRYDEYYGIANITTSDGEVLRIDLKTKAEEAEKSNSNKKDLNNNNNTKSSAKKNTIAASSTIDFLNALGGQETRGKKNPYMCINYAGYVGKYQMGEQAMIEMGIYKKEPDKIINGKAYYNNNWKGIFLKNDYGITCLWDYRTSPDKQEALQVDYKKRDWSYIKKLGLDKYLNKIVNGQKITASGLLAGAHLVGVGGLKRYLEGDYSVHDRSGTPVSRYIKQFANYKVSEIIN